MNLADAHAALKQYFGYETFRPMQAEIVEAVLGGRDCLVLMPTGGGKSLCFQLPALIMPGVCVVVSPLIALMKDQVEALLANGVSAAYVNSSQSYEEQRGVLARAEAGALKLLYVSPEKLMSRGFERALERLRVSLFAIDEAHCISAWGHDFRPEYAQLGVLKERFPGVPLVALTATADRITRRDIMQQLYRERPEVFIASFDRPNIGLSVLPGRDRFRYIRAFIENRRGQSGIIYCLSRRQTEALARKLAGVGLRVGFYHAGMTSQERAMTQEAFIKDDLPIVCATVAFGMGIDKSNVRWVIHYNMPKNVESYYQEVGRAGRDSEPSEAVLFYTFGDVMTLRKMLGETAADPDHQGLKLAKLERMQQYADAAMCRRKILLSYFGEVLEGDCGNCDVCADPPKFFDGTVVAQKALSALYRLREHPMQASTLVSVLRGHRRRELREAGLDQIPTFGAGAEIGTKDWHEYLMQLLNLGLIEVAYDEGYALRLTPDSRPVLLGERSVQLIDLATLRERAAHQVERAKPTTAAETYDEALFDALRALRKEISDARGVPAYVVFSDATLRAMAAHKPVDERAMMQVPGVGRHKLSVYGQRFIDQISRFCAQAPG